MQTRYQKIELADAPDFGWPVKIRVRATTSPSAPPQSPNLPASPDFLADAMKDARQGVASEAAAPAPDPNPSTPDWRIFGEQDEGAEE
jgi:hypothetical protein